MNTLFKGMAGWFTVELINQFLCLAFKLSNGSLLIARLWNWFLNVFG